jgi:hypothetical protein
MSQLERIKEKLKLLKKSDSSFSQFGASRHKYLFNPPLTFDRIQKFEKDNGIKLPTEYIRFFTEIGNGGAGPFYGLEPLENSLYDDLDKKNSDSLLTPSKPFSHTSAWNQKFEPGVEDKKGEYENELNNFEKEYFDNKHMNGVIAICNYGCGVSINLVVNGEEYGNIWTDDRSSDYGIHPSEELGNSGRITFLDWYERWLDDSLTELENPNE